MEYEIWAKLLPVRLLRLNEVAVIRMDYGLMLNWASYCQSG